MTPNPVTGELEYAVLSMLCQRGDASARELYDAIGAPQGLVYTTIAKVLDRLHEKRFVRRRKVGKAFVYRAVHKREEIERVRTNSALSQILGDEPAPAMATLVDAVEAIDPDLLDVLLLQVQAKRRARRGS